MGNKFSDEDQQLLVSVYHDDFEKFQKIIKLLDPHRILKIPPNLARSFGLPTDVEFTLLHILVHYSRKNLIVYFFSRFEELNIDLQDQFGFTCLMKAVRAGKEEIVQVLLEHGADPLKPNQFDSGDTALHYACEAGDLKTFLVLLNTCPSLDQRNREGLTPLMYAVQRKHLKIVKTLVKMRADPYLSDYSGFSSFDHARSQRFSEKQLKALEVNETKGNVRKNDSNDTFFSFTERSFLAEETKKTSSLAFFIAKGLDLLISEQVSWVR